MSRNIAEGTSCYFCGSKLELEEKARPITEAEAGVYFSEYETWLLVAKAHCRLCLTRYLAWMSCHPGWLSSHDGDEQGIVDLSFRSTFNDEPGVEDMPTHATATVTQITGRFADSDHFLAERYREELRQRDARTATNFVMGVIEGDKGGASTHAKKWRAAVRYPAISCRSCGYLVQEPCKKALPDDRHVCARPKGHTDDCSLNCVCASKGPTP